MKKTTINIVSEKLRWDIIHGSLNSGDHIIEKEIAKRFKVSRIPVREALIILEGEGYITKIPNKGNFVKKITYDSIKELGLLFEVLVPFILIDSIPKYSAKTYSKVSKILKKIEKSSDSLEITDLIWEFKKTVFIRTRYKYIFHIIENVYKHSMRLVSILIESMDQKKFNVDSYIEFMRLCKLNKKEEAIKVFMEFVSVEVKLLTDMFEKK